MSKLILMRHGLSVWNQLNLFTGWVDVPLAKEGIDESLSCGEQIKNLPIDVIFTSALVRAQMSAFLAMIPHSSKKVPVVMHEGEGKMDEWAQIHNEAAKEACVPVYCAWELNERMYGDLQGLNKAETIKKFGADQVKLWRRSYDTAPPNGESLADTAMRTLPYFEEKIVPFLSRGLNVFIAAHGNSLRAIVMDIEGLSKEEIIKFEIPTGIPLIYEYRAGSFHKLEELTSTSHDLLGQ